MAKKELWQLDKIVDGKKEIVKMSSNKKELEYEYNKLVKEGYTANLFIINHQHSFLKL